MYKEQTGNFFFLFLAFLKTVGWGLVILYKVLHLTSELTIGQVLHPSMKNATVYHVKLGVDPCQNVEWVAKWWKQYTNLDNFSKWQKLQCGLTLLTNFNIHLNSGRGRGNMI